MKLISSVIHNRLKNPSQTAGRLECDSTKDYIKKYVTPITDVNLVNKYADAYNTYSAQGLPPGPICNPGAAAIKAALYPSNTKYYYFCHDKFGNIYMARTKSEHDANVLKLSARTESQGAGKTLAPLSMKRSAAMDIIRPEVLAPAGDAERLKAAVYYGADAVYLAERASVCVLRRRIFRTMSLQKPCRLPMKTVLKFILPAILFQILPSSKNCRNFLKPLRLPESMR